MRSLSLLMFLALLGGVVLSGAVSALFAYRSGLIEVDELFDAKLAHSARVLAALLDEAASGDEVHHAPIAVELWSGGVEGEGDALATASGHAYETKLAFQVWRGDTLVVHSTNAPRGSPLAPRVPGFHTVQLDDGQWRSFVLPASSGAWYIAGERFDVRDELAGEIAAELLLPLLLQIPALGLLIAGVIHLGRRSLAHVADQVGRRAADRLDPIDPRDMPVEMRGVVESVNALLRDLAEALDRERRFTADAAHELRTPLAALRVLVGNARTARSDSERRESIEQLDRATQRLERLVSQMLVLSRLEPRAGMPEPKPVDLVESAREVLEELGSLDHARQIELALQAPEHPLCAMADPSTILLVIRNLVDNAIRYAGRGQVQVRVSRTGDTVRLDVEDSGPGIPQDDRKRVLDRFYRRLGTREEGSGLGLSIVDRVLQIYGGRLTLDASPELGGLRATVEFTACPAS